jgi:hypothetical protein
MTATDREFRLGLLSSLAVFPESTKLSSDEASMTLVK